MTRVLVVDDEPPGDVGFSPDATAFSPIAPPVLQQIWLLR
jgi:hypothetical protein